MKKIAVKIKFRDDKEKTFECIDYPSVGDWIILFGIDMSRIFLPREAIERIDCSCE